MFELNYFAGLFSPCLTAQHPCCKCNSLIVSDKVTISCLVLSNKFTHQHKYLQDNAGLILLIVSTWFAVKLFLYFFQLIVAYVAMFFCSFFVFFFFFST